MTIRLIIGTYLGVWLGDGGRDLDDELDLGAERE